MIVSFLALSRYLMQNNCRSTHLKRNFNMSTIIQQRTEQLINFKQLHSFKNILPFGNFMSNSIPNIKRFSILVILKNELKHAPRFLKDNSLSVFKSCVSQVEYVIAYRIRRGQQIISLYSKLWDEMALKRFIQQIRRLAYKRSKEFLFGAATLAFDWKTNKISEDELKNHANELELCHFLRDMIVQEKVCLCQTEACRNDINIDVSLWSPFIKQNDLIVWKKEEEDHKGLYCYKMYGKYMDVTAKDFLAVFLDLENRTKWDQHVVELKLIDSEPCTNSDIIYWETKWPTLFSNRDYVFTRRYMIDENEKVIIVMNRSSSHPDYPAMQSKSRVNEYWSYMVIKPTSEFNQPGIEFSLTYFDNPGMSVPSAISLWVSSTGMPEYVKRLRIEALKIYEERKKREEIAIMESNKREEIENKDKREEKSKEKEPPTTGGGGGHEDEPSIQPHSTSKERSFEPYLLWASFMEKIRAKA